MCRRWGITPWQLRAIRDRAKDASTEAFARGPGRPRKDALVAELEAGLASLKGFMDLGDHQHILGKVNGA